MQLCKSEVVYVKVCEVVLLVQACGRERENISDNGRKYAPLFYHVLLQVAAAANQIAFVIGI